MFDHRNNERREVFVTDRFAVARNVATNARLFCVMQFVACLTLYATTKNQSFVALALLSAGSVGVSVLVDPLPPGFIKRFLTAFAYLLAVAAFFLTIIKLG